MIEEEVRQQHSDEGQVLPSGLAHVDEPYDNLVDLGSHDDHDQADHVGCVGRDYGVRPGYHEHYRAEEQSVQDKLERVDVGEEDFIEPGDPVSVDGLDCGTVSDHLEHQEEETGILLSLIHI